MRHKNVVCILIGIFCLLELCADMRAAAAADYAALRIANGGRIAHAQRFITSVKPAVIFTFGGLSKQEALNDILHEMEAQGMRGTFFVTERELQRNGDNIARIVAEGQDLGVGLRPVEGADFADYCAQIERIQTALRTRYGTETNVVRQMSGAEEDVIGEAVSAMGCVLVGQSVNIVQSKHKNAQSAEEVMPQLFGRWTTSLNRGAIVYLRTDFYTRPALAAEMLHAVVTAKVDNIAYTSFGSAGAQAMHEREASRYAMISVADGLRDTAACYTYPVDLSALPEEMRPCVRSPLLEGRAFSKEFFKRYIGAPEVGENDRMLGFSRSEIAQADQTGIVKTVADNTVFLTFDDWGSDDTINHLLYVLRKHEVHGTFFVITWNIHNNPNLLRAIAAEGNEIGSHTDVHKPMTVQDKKGRQVADMKLPSGRYVLTRLLRPPTLAVSRMGVAAILNNGFTYVVNGSGSTEDYDAVTMESLVGIMHRLTHETDGSVKRGAILVMHMSSTAARTAEALDILLTANDALPEGHPGKFKIGLLGDYLTGDYDQTMKQVKPAAGYKLH